MAIEGTTEWVRCVQFEANWLKEEGVPRCVGVGLECRIGGRGEFEL